MDSLLVANGVVVVAIVVALIWIFLQFYFKRTQNHLAQGYGLLSFGYASLLVMYSVWVLKIAEYTVFDYSLILAALLFFQTIILTYMFYWITHRSTLFYWFLFYGGGLIAISSLYYFSFFMLIISYMITLLMLVQLLTFNRSYLSIVQKGIFYCVFSLVGLLVSFAYTDYFLAFTFFSHVFLLLFLFSFSRDFNRIPLYKESKHRMEDSSVLLFVKYFAFILVIVNLVFVGTIALHELGHVSVARFYDCDSRTIVFEVGSYPYSEIVCTGLEGKLFISLAGFVFPTLFGMILYFIGTILRPFALLMIGFNFLASYRDLSDIGVSTNLGIGLSLCGFTFVSIGLIYLARERVNESFTPPHGSK